VTTFVLHVTRDPGASMPLELRLRARARPELPDLIVELPAGVPELLEPVRGPLAGADYAVIDASPFPRPCPGGRHGCAWLAGAGRAPVTR
jgi:hypothetical protein